MKIGDFPMVERIMAARNKLIEQRDQGKFDVVISGTYQDMEMVARARSAIVTVLDERIEELDKDLDQLGVNVG